MSGSVPDVRGLKEAKRFIGVVHQISLPEAEEIIGGPEEPGDRGGLRTPPRYHEIYASDGRRAPKVFSTILYNRDPYGKPRII